MKFNEFINDFKDEQTFCKVKSQAFMYNIRYYQKDRDFDMLSQWWKDAKEPGPDSDMLPEESTLVLEINGEAAYCISIYYTNSKTFCLFENFIRNPQLKHNHEAAQLLIDSAATLAKLHGYKKAVTFAYKDKLKEKCSQLGFHKTLENLISFVKVLE